MFWELKKHRGWHYDEFFELMPMEADLFYNLLLKDIKEENEERERQIKEAARR